MSRRLAATDFTHVKANASQSSEELGGDVGESGRILGAAGRLRGGGTGGAGASDVETEEKVGQVEMG